MRESVEFIELTSLEKTGKDRWKFRIKHNASFISMFESLYKAHVFEAHSVYWPGDNDQYYLVNDQGIWLLSHCFSNWDEMYEKIGKKRAEQDTPPEHVNCRTNFKDNFGFERAYRLYQNGIWSATQFQEYRNEQQQKTKQGESERGGDFYYCSGCHIHYNKQFSPPAWTCPQCQADLCPTCRLKHTHVRAHQTSQTDPKYTYTNSQEGGHINLDDLWKTFEEMKNKRFQWQTFDFGSWQTDEETNAGQQQQQTRSNSQSSTRPVLTSEIREAFKLFGLPPAATEQEIKRKFRVLAKQMHPDAGGSEEQFKKLNNACEKVLAYAKGNKPK